MSAVGATNLPPESGAETALPMGTPSDLERRKLRSSVPPAVSVEVDDIDALEILRDVSSPLLPKQMPPPLVSRSSSARADPRDFTAAPSTLMVAEPKAETMDNAHEEEEEEKEEASFLSSPPLMDMTNSSSLLDLTKAFKSPSPRKRVIMRAPVEAYGQPASKSTVMLSSSSQPSSKAAAETTSPIAVPSDVATASSSSSGLLFFVTDHIHTAMAFVLGLPLRLVLLPVRLAQLALRAVLAFWAALAFSVLGGLLGLAETFLGLVGLDTWSIPANGLKVARGALVKAQAAW